VSPTNGVVHTGWVRLPQGHLRLHVRQWTPAEAAGPPRSPILLVHGLASNARLWDGVAGALAAAGHGVTAVDLRGHGRSDKPSTGYDHPTMLADLRVVLRAIGGRPLVVGQSWGGSLALELGWRHPENILGVACVDGGTIDLAARWPEYADCEAALAPPVLDGLHAAELAARLRAAHPDWPEDGITAQLACFRERPDGTLAPLLTRERHLLLLRALWAQRPSTWYHRVAVGVLLLPTCGGAGDWAHKPAEVAAAEAALPRARVRWLSDSDHDVHVQRPRAVADAILEALTDGCFGAATGTPHTSTAFPTMGP
jgi:pimeloyl-ACP methyl ester carboxylesterase